MTGPFVRVTTVIYEIADDIRVVRIYRVRHRREVYGNIAEI